MAVHGLNGDQVNTWTNPKTEAFWLRDYLPLDIPSARVMTFGYNADAAFGNTTADISDHAQDLLSSLFDRREKDDVKLVYSTSEPSATANVRVIGAEEASSVCCSFSRWNCGKAGNL